MADGCFKTSGQSSTMRMNGKEIVCLILMPTNHRAEWNGHRGMTYEGLEKPMLSGFVAPKCGHLESLNLHASIWCISDPW